MTGFIIRYRCADRHGQIALIVVGGRGEAYLFSGGILQARLTGGDASARLARLLGRSATCAPLAEATPQTLDALQRLTAPLAALQTAVA